jgi:hypothetical protein
VCVCVCVCVYVCVCVCECVCVCVCTYSCILHRQTLHHWAIEITAQHLQRAKK